MSVRVACAALLAGAWICTSCGGGGSAEGASEPSAGDDEGGGDGECRAPNEVQHPTYRSERLTLELVDSSHGIEGMVIPPFEIEASTTEDLSSPVEMELTIHDPAGRTHVQRFTYVNMREECDPYCDPVNDASDCPPRQCRMERYRPSAIRIDHTMYRSSMPGEWTYVLRRLDTTDRVSVTRHLFEGPEVEDDECDALPVALGDFRRTSCQRGVVPMGVSTNYWGIKARYERDGCRVNAFALPIRHDVRTVFDEGPYRAAPLRSFPDGDVHELDLGQVTARAWLAHHHAYVLAAASDMRRFDDVVSAMLATYPVVGGPVRAIPGCAATGAVTDVTVPPATLDALRDQAGFTTHFEGNRPSGVRLRFHDQHPLARAGLRRGEIVHTVDGRRTDRRGEIDAVLDRMTRPGTLELVVARARVTHARCVRVTIDPSAPATTSVATSGAQRPQQVQPQGPPQQPGRGRHCERRSDQCWDCVDIAFPATIGSCRRACGRRDLCVHTGGKDVCLAPTRVCCQPGAECNTPPGCDGAASSCSSAAPGGRTERCTFLSACPQPLPTH